MHIEAMQNHQVFKAIRERKTNRTDRVGRLTWERYEFLLRTDGSLWVRRFVQYEQKQGITEYPWEYQEKIKFPENLKTFLILKGYKVS